MKKLLLILTLFLGACQQERTPENLPSAQAQKQTWQCPMHPQILRDHKEPCPICGMALVQVKETKHSTSLTGESPILDLEPAVIQKTGVRVVGVTQDTLSEILKGFGSTALNDNHSQVLALRVKVFVTQITPLSIGNSVRKGQLLAQVYSPEWSQVLGEIQLARDNARILGESTVLLTNAMTKAENLGLDAHLIQSVAKGGKIPASIPLRSPESGIILDKNIVNGQAIEAGTPLFRMADMSTLWLLAEFPQSTITKVSKGMKAQVRLDVDLNQVLEAQVEEILPSLSSESKNAVLRLRLANRNGKIKIGQSAKIDLQIRSQSGIFVPEQAIIPSGDKFFVIRALGAGQFQVRQIRPGTHAQGKIQVLEGLAIGDSIVESAQFLMDSESNLRAVIKSFEGADHAAHAH